MKRYTVTANQYLEAVREEDDHGIYCLFSEADSEFRELRERCERLERERLALAMLAAEKPMFDNPLTVYAAKEIRDRVLKEPIPGATR